jgi:ABC-type multidrug transport system permease subunit
MDDYGQAPPTAEGGAFGGAPVRPPAPSMNAVATALGRTAPWTQFVSILLFVSVGLMILVGLAAGAVGIATERAETAVFMVVYPLMGLLYFFPALYLLQYSKRIGRYVRGGRQLADLETALDAQRRFWKFVGILAIVWIVVSVVAIAAAFLLATVARRFSM